MAEHQSGDKTEKPTQQKLRRARQSGSVARSRDMSTAVGIFVALELVILLAPGWLKDFRALFVLGFSDLTGTSTLENTWSILLPGSLALLAKLLLPLFAIPVCIVAGSIFPGGWVLSVDNLKPRFNRLDPATNIGRLFSARHYSTFAISVLKAFTLIASVWYVIRSSLTDFVQLQGTTLPEALAGGVDLFRGATMTLVMVMIVFAFIDVPVQSFIFLRGQRMTKQEVKEEYKTSEGRPEVKGRIRQLQRQIAQRSLAKTIPTADVVIVNPTHYAVALKYDAAKAEAPFVVAKGIDGMALAIRQLARQHGIEVLPLPPLARAIYHTSQVNQQIPGALYRAVAQVLTYVMQLRAFQQGRRRYAPAMPTDLEVPESLSEKPGS